MIIVCLFECFRQVPQSSPVDSSTEPPSGQKRPASYLVNNNLSVGSVPQNTSLGQDVRCNLYLNYRFLFSRSREIPLSQALWIVSSVLR